MINNYLQRKRVWLCVLIVPKLANIRQLKSIEIYFNMIFKIQIYL